MCKVSPTTSVIKEPHKQEVRVRNSDIAKFGTRAETDTDLAQYIEKRPKMINEKTVEHKIYKHKRDFIRRNDEAFLNRPDLTQILRFSPIAPQLTTSNTAGPSGMQMPSSVQPTATPILRKTTKRQITISDTSDSDTYSVRKSKRTLKKKTPKSQTIIEKVRNTQGYSDNAHQDIGDARNLTERVEDTQNQPREMTVFKAENAENSDSE